MEEFEEELSDVNWEIPKVFRSLEEALRALGIDAREEEE